MAASHAKPRAKPSRVGYSRRNRLDKLGVKEGMRVAILGVDDAFIRRALAQRTNDVSRPCEGGRCFRHQLLLGWP
jgi:hypothetical protein